MNVPDNDTIKENHQEDEMQVGVKALIRHPLENDRFLCVQKSEKYFGQWEIPGGRIAAYEHPKEELVRELVEELSFHEAVIGRLVNAGPAGVHPVWKPLFYVMYEVELPLDFVIILSDEHQGYDWLTVEEIAELEGFNPALVKLISEVA